MNDPIVSIIGILSLGTIIIGELISGDVWNKFGGAKLTKKDNPLSYWMAITLKAFAICFIIWNIDRQKLIESNIGYKAAMVIITISWVGMVALLGFYLKEKKSE